MRQASAEASLRETSLSLTWILKVRHHHLGHPDCISDVICINSAGNFRDKCPSGFPNFGGRHVSRHVLCLCFAAKDGTYYYWSTAHLQERVREHNAGKAKFTKGHRPYVLHYKETFATKSAALSREKFFKSIDGYNRLRAKGIIATT